MDRRVWSLWVTAAHSLQHNDCGSSIPWKGTLHHGGTTLLRGDQSLVLLTACILSGAVNVEESVDWVRVLKHNQNAPVRGSPRTLRIANVLESSPAAIQLAEPKDETKAMEVEAKHETIQRCYLSLLWFLPIMTRDDSEAV